MPPPTPAERKAAERARRRSQGLVLKQIWSTPEMWPIISDLATSEAEEHVNHAILRGGAYSGITTFSNEVPVEFAYETALEMQNEILAIGEAVLGADLAAPFLSHVLRAALKTFDPSRRAPPYQVEAMKEEIS